MTNNSIPLKVRKKRAFVALGIACVAACLLAIGSFQLYKTFAVGAWPTTKGIVKSVEIERDKSRLPPFSRYEAKLVYHYTVGDKEFVGNSIRPTPVSAKYEGELDWVKGQYSVGSCHPVFYMASDPSVAYLQYSPGIGSYILIVTTLSLIVAGLWDFVDYLSAST